MRCVVSLLLMPCCLIGQGAPHAHRGGMCEPHDHPLRPHVHSHDATCGLQHAHHGDEDHDARTSVPGLASVNDHDADAYYGCGALSRTERRSASRSADRDSHGTAAVDHVRLVDPQCARLVRLLGVAPPGNVGALPLYLANASLRI